MKRFLLKHGHLLALFALSVTTYAANRSCALFFFQSELPDEAKKLRKF